MAYSILISWSVLDLGRRQEKVVRVGRKGVPLSQHWTQYNPTPSPASLGTSLSSQFTHTSPMHATYDHAAGSHAHLCAQAQSPLGSYTPAPAPLTPCFSDTGSVTLNRDPKLGPKSPCLRCSCPQGRVQLTLAGGESYHLMLTSGALKVTYSPETS